MWADADCRLKQDAAGHLTVPLSLFSNDFIYIELNISLYPPATLRQVANASRLAIRIHAEQQAHVIIVGQRLVRPEPQPNSYSTNIRSRQD